jgi:hypothetical protein
MTSPENKQLSSTSNNHCYDIDQKPFIDQKPNFLVDQKPSFQDFCSSSTIESNNGMATPQPNNPYSGYPFSTSAINGNPHFYPFNNMTYPTNNSTPQSTPFLYHQAASTSPESKYLSELKSIYFYWKYIGLMEKF